VLAQEDAWTGVDHDIVVCASTTTFSAAVISDESKALTAATPRTTDGLAFVAPIFWMNFPAILRGWVERVFTYGVVCTMSEEGWLHGDLGGRKPLMKQRKALIMTPTFFRESDYKASGFGDAIARLIDDFGFRYPGSRRSSTSTSARSGLSGRRRDSAICRGRIGSAMSSSHL
jgi:putative NADPH-quinone reductase